MYLHLFLFASSVSLHTEIQNCFTVLLLLCSPEPLLRYRLWDWECFLALCHCSSQIFAKSSEFRLRSEYAQTGYY